jgi:hypothetical protein
VRPELPEFPEFPEFPELPELPDWAVPEASTGPVSPEFASPELAVVWFELPDVAFPVELPVVWPVAELSPLLPDVALAVDPSLAFPARPDVAVPLALPDEWLGCGPWPQWPGAPAPAVPAARNSAAPAAADAHSVLLMCVLMIELIPFEMLLRADLAGSSLVNSEE